MARANSMGSRVGPFPFKAILLVILAKLGTLQIRDNGHHAKKTCQTLNPWFGIRAIVLGKSVGKAASGNLAAQARGQLSSFRIFAASPKRKSPTLRAVSLLVVYSIIFLSILFYSIAI